MFNRVETFDSSNGILGGISYFLASAERGFVCDSVINYEIALASGEIISVNKHSHLDLFIALREGPGDFGIVVSIEFPTFKLGGMWGGAIFQANTAYRELIIAFGDFAKDPSPDEKTYIIIATGWVQIRGEICCSNLYHATLATEAPPFLKPFSCKFEALFVESYTSLQSVLT